MPTLSFIRPRAPKWISIVPNRNPFPASRDENTNTFHPYASAEVIDIHDANTSFQSTVNEHQRPPAEQSPNIQIQLDIPSEPFGSDWFQTRFTSAPASPRPTLNGQRVEGSGTAAGEGRPLVPIDRSDPPQSVPAEVPTDDEEEDFDLSTSEDDVLGRLRAMDASTFVNLPPHLNSSAQPNQVSEPPQPPPRRNPPTPIRIPTLPGHGSQVQIVRSADPNASRPLSEISTAESSAVSGQTLARALMGNSFVLSSDARSSRYRSGFGGLVRSDSATLPRGDHPLMNSPHWRDRTLSGTSDTFAADSNAPPIPPNADKVYVPPQNHRHSGNETKRKANVRRHSSTGSLPSPSSKGDSNYSRSRPSSLAELGQEIDVQALRRISRISEAPSSTSTTPANPDIAHFFPSPPPKSPIETSSIQSDSALPPAPPSKPPSPPPKPILNPGDFSLEGLSPGPSVMSSISPGKELENVLEYYSDKPERVFAPAVSPIIEESSSQLSSPGSKRLSSIGTPRSRAMSPLSGTTNGRIDLSTVRRPSDGALINRTSSLHRRSVLPSPQDSGSSSPAPSQASQNVNSTANAANPRSSLSPARPFGSVVGGRLRSGSAPSPIKITRDSRDLNSYKIVSPLPESALETPSTGDSDKMATQQTFPETPNAFSPFLSAGSAMSPGMIQKLPEGYEIIPMPHTPRSAALPTQGRGLHPSLDQQVLLTRSTSMANHSRQTNTSSGVPRAQTKPEAPENTSKDGDQVVHVPPSDPSEMSPVSSVSVYSETSAEAHLPYPEASFGFSAVEASARVGATSPSTVGSSPMLDYVIRDDLTNYSSSVSTTTLPPAHSSQSHSFGSTPEFLDPFDSQLHPASPRFNQRTSGISPHNRPIPTPPVVITPPAGESTSAPSYHGHSLRRISEISHNLESPPPYDTIDHDRPPPISVTHSTESNNESHHLTLSTRPYPSTSHESSNEHLPLGRKTSGRERRVRMRPTGPRRPLSHINNPPSGNHPPPPHRPRMPSDASVISVTPTLNTAASTPQIPSTTPVIHQTSLTITPPPPNLQFESKSSSSGTATTVNNTVVPSPRSPSFNVPAMPYRGLTMDQAKWTFTSAQLQTIVSRAVKQSAEASSIRLLRLDTLDKDIPPELERLEARKTEIKANYRSLTRSSESLYTKLSSQVAAGSYGAQGTLEELRDVTRQLNKLTEELHSVDQQHSQIRHLVQVHSASALSMALRKLNASFLKQLSETQDLRRQVGELEDEIWTLNELRSTKVPANNQLLQSQLQPYASSSQDDSADHNSFQPHPQSHGFAQASSSQEGHSDQNPSPTNPTGGFSGVSRRGSTHIVTRKPSLRYSRSIRWSGHRLSQRSSLSSNGARSSVGGASGTNMTFEIPPVPPLPRRRPTDIVTDTPARSAAATSLDGGTPNTEVRALMRTQDELYRMLGVTLRGDSRLRRSHSIIGLPGSPEIHHRQSPSPAILFAPTGPVPRISRTESMDSALQSSRNSRPMSHPASTQEAYNPMEADRKAMLATLEMISQDDH